MKAALDYPRSKYHSASFDIISKAPLRGDRSNVKCTVRLIFSASILDLVAPRHTSFSFPLLTLPHDIYQMRATCSG